MRKFKRANERGREGTENAISDGLETQNFQNIAAQCQGKLTRWVGKRAHAQ
jgi:hypothetical protein